MGSIPDPGASILSAKWPSQKKKNKTVTTTTKNKHLTGSLSRLIELSVGKSSALSLGQGEGTAGVVART